MPAPDSPAWRRAFDSVETRLGGPLAAATSSTEFQRATQQLRRARRAIMHPVRTVVTSGLGLIGLPSTSDIQALRRQLGEVQREVLALRRDAAVTDRDEESPR